MKIINNNKVPSVEIQERIKFHFYSYADHVNLRNRKTKTAATVRQWTKMALAPVSCDKQQDTTRSKKKPNKQRYKS